MNALLDRLKTRAIYLVLTAVLGWVSTRFGWLNLPSPEKITDWLVAAGALAGFADWIKLAKQHAWGVLWANLKTMLKAFPGDDSSSGENPK